MGLNGWVKLDAVTLVPGLGCHPATRQELICKLSVGCAWPGHEGFEPGPGGAWALVVPGPCCWTLTALALSTQATIMPGGLYVRLGTREIYVKIAIQTWGRDRDRVGI